MGKKYTTESLKEEIKLDYLWAALCMLGAVFFIFREKIMAAI